MASYFDLIDYDSEYDTSDSSSSYSGLVDEFGFDFPSYFPRENYAGLARDRSHDRLTSSVYPHIGPRFLNNITQELSNERISGTNMSRYYTFIKGYDIRLLGIDRPLFERDDEMDIRYTGVDDRIYSIEQLGEEQNFDFDVSGWVEHHPKKDWCYVDPNYSSVYIRNELDCVGYIGTGKYLKDLSFDSLVGKTIHKLNILPSLFQYETYCPGNELACLVFQGTSKWNWIAMNRPDYSGRVYVQLTDYDCYNLAVKTPYFPGLDSFIGKTGLVYEFGITIPNLESLDGYRFWYWMYNALNAHRIQMDPYFAGSAVRNQRAEGRDETDVSVVRDLFVEDEVILQGGTFSTLQEAYSSVNEIGKFAKTANDAKTVIDGYLEQPWMQSIIQYITSIASNIAQLVVEFEKFREDPLGYLRKLSADMVRKFSFPHLNVTQAQAGLIIGAAFYLFEKSQIVSLGLFLFGYYIVFKQCYDSTIYAEMASLLVTLVSIGVLKATQLRPVSITLQSNTSLTSMIFAACSFLTLGFATKGVTTSHDSVIRHLFNNTKDIFAISRGTLSLTKCIEYVLDALKASLDYVFGNSFAYNTLLKMTVTSKDLQEYIQYCLTTMPEDLAVKLTLDFDSRKQWDRICGLHKDLIKLFASGTPPTETHIGYSMYVRACASFTKLCQEYEKIKHALDHFRPEPFMVWIWGEPGTGKTWCRDQFANNMYRWHSAIDPTLSDAKLTGLLYVRNPADKYMSKYNGEFAVAYDDVGQNRQADNPEFNEIMGFGSTNQVKLNMADLEDKGRLFSSKAVIMAANSREVVSNKLILKDAAFNRRRHVVIELARPKLETDDLNLSTSKCDFTKVRLTLTDPISGELIKSFPEEEGFGDDKTEFRKLFEWLAPRYAKHVQDQHAGLEKKQKSLFAVLNNEDDEAIVDVPEELRFKKCENVDWKKLGKFQQISHFLGKDEDLDLAVEGIRNCFTHDMEPSELMKEHFNNFCRTKGIEEFKEAEWKFLRNEIPTMENDKLASVQDLWDERIKGLERKSHWYTLLKWTGVALSGLSMYKLFAHFMQEDNKDLFSVQGYTQDIRHPPKQGKVVVQGYSVEVRAAKSNKVVIQGKQELLDYVPQPGSLTSLTSNLMKSVAKFSKETTPGNFAFVNGFNVCYNAWLIPRHFLGKTLEDCLLRIDREGIRPEVVSIQKENIFSLFIDGKERDVCLVRIPSLPHGKHHLKHFATRKHLEMVKNFDATMLRWDSDTSSVVKAALGDAIRWELPLCVDADGNELYYSSGYKYNFNTMMGDCGSLLISNDNTTKARIFGIHFGFNNTEKKGMSQHVCKEDIEMLVNAAIPFVDRIEEQPPKVDLQFAECPKTLCDNEGKPYFEFLGYVRDGPLPPKDHGDFHRSPLYGEVYPPEKDLSVLNKWDSRLSEEHRGDPDILVRGVIDFAYESIPWPEQELKIATQALKSEMEKFQVPIGKQLLTLDEAINGIWVDGQRLEYSEDINLKTAAGYGFHGVKRDHFVTEEIRDLLTNKLLKVEHRIANPKLQQQVDDMWKDWMDGKTHSIPWSHTLKIEALKMSKIPTGNTRTFCVASTALLLNVRRLFGAFTTAMKKSRIVSFSCLGVDANSRDWNDLYDNLRKTGTHGADMDFFKFDRTAVTWQLARKVCEAINEWYNDSQENQRARIIAFEEMIFAYGLINKFLTRKVRGNPSGNPLTTELNNCVNYLMLCMVYLLIAKQRKPTEYRIESWKKNVNMKAYGDDIIFTLHPTCAEWFDFSLLSDIYAKYGVPVTPADKSDDGIVLRPLHELTFLKRNFRPYDNAEVPDVKWQSALSKSSIRSMIQFYRLKPNNGTMYEAIQTNCMESLIEAYHWGEEFFTEHSNKINAWMRDNSYATIPITYAELDETYRKKLELGS